MPKVNKSKQSFSVYILECADKSLYTGIALDLKKRLIQHNEAKEGAHYTKTRRPVILRYSEKCGTRSNALKREYVVKNMSRTEKLCLIKKKKGK